MKIESYLVYRLIYCLMFFFILGALAIGLYAFISESFGSFWEYSSFEISDWLINYEGGFVRRGMVGQLLYMLYQIHPYPVRYAIVLLYILGFIFISGLLVYILKNEGLSIFLLPFTIGLYYAFTCDMLWTRRDYWALMIAFSIFYFYFKYIQSFTIKYLIIFYLLSTITLLMHEASFFFTFPVLIMCGFYHCSHKKKDFFRMLVIWLPIVLLFLFVVMHKGDAEVMTAIWQSWEPCFIAYPTGNGEIPGTGNGVEFLNMTSIEAIALHIRLVWLARFAPYVPSFPFNIYLIICTYYLVTRLNIVDMKVYKLHAYDKILLSNIVIVQFVFLLPMFGFLSCDLGRVIPYWVISSLFLYYIVDKNNISSNIVPLFVTRFSIWAQGKMDQLSFLNKPWMYCVLIITLPLNCYYGATYGGIVPIQYLLKALKILNL